MSWQFPNTARSARHAHTASRLLVAGIMFLLLSLQTVSAEQKMFTATGKAVISGNISYDQARTFALHQARAKAVEQAAGININSTSVIKDNLMLVDLVKTFSRGFIVEESIQQWKNSWLPDNDPLQPGYPVLEVTLTGIVDVPPKSFFRNHNLTVKINRSQFQEGDRVEFAITAKQDMYVVIANYTSSNRIIPVFPNSLNSGNLIQAGKTLSIPDKEKNRLRITVTNYPGHTLDTEAFIIFGFPKNSRTDEIPWPRVFDSGREIAYAEFFKILLDLPVKWIAEKTLVYSVAKQPS